MDLGRLAPASKVTCRRTYLTILKRAWSANFKMVWYVLRRPLRPEPNGQDPFQICEACVNSQTRKTPTLTTRTTSRTAKQNDLAGKTRLSLTPYGTYQITHFLYLGYICMCMCILYWPVNSILRIGLPGHAYAWCPWPGYKKVLHRWDGVCRIRDMKNKFQVWVDMSFSKLGH
jgi:hypothetical protein